MPPDVREALLDDAEELDLLVRVEAHVRVDLEVDLECAVGGQQLDVALQRGVERRDTCRRRESEDCEAGLLLRRLRRLLDLRDELLGGPALLEHRRVCRDREQVLRETVVNLACKSRAFLRDRATELGCLDRPPNTDAEHAVAEHAEEVAGRDLDVPEQRREDEEQRREEHQ